MVSRRAGGGDRHHPTACLPGTDHAPAVRSRIQRKVVHGRPSRDIVVPQGLVRGVPSGSGAVSVRRDAYRECRTLATSIDNGTAGPLDAIKLGDAMRRDHFCREAIERVAVRRP